jgi:hypothetical protein
MNQLGWEQAAALEIEDDPFTLEWRAEAGRRTIEAQHREAAQRADPAPNLPVRPR